MLALFVCVGGEGMWVGKGVYILYIICMYVFMCIVCVCILPVHAYCIICTVCTGVCVKQQVQGDP